MENLVGIEISVDTLYPAVYHFYLRVVGGCHRVLILGQSAEVVCF